MNFKDRFSFVLSTLAELMPYIEADAECIMVTVILSGIDEVCPELFQIIKTNANEYYVQRLEKGTHRKLYDKNITKNELQSLTSEITSGLDITLTWGPYGLINYKFN
jgi:hypothetical protein